MTEIAVKAENLGKRFKIYPDPMGRFVEMFSFGKAVRHEEVWALKNIHFELPRGSALGIIGANGAGKSTLLKVVSGTTPPTTGSFSVNGRLGSLLELGAGFHPEFSGRDNIFMNAAIMGISKREVKERFDELADFAELGEYLGRPVRTYSSGMAMRLGFAVAMMSHPDVLILDEVLAVGDQHFQKKCMDRIREIRQSGTTILFVSHSVYHVRQICDRAIWIHNGEMIQHGDPTRVTDDYVNFQYAQSAGKAAQLEQTGHAVVAELPHLGDLKVCRAGESEDCETFGTGDTVDFHLGFKNPSGEGTHHLGLIVSRNDDIQVFTSRSKEYGQRVTGTSGSLIMRVKLPLTSGEYYVSGFLLDESCDHVMDQRLAWNRFKVEYNGMEKGVILADCQWLTPQEAV
ncbi:MAG: hypothetical protein CMJ83_02110 [Planctomycetes bacterium]|nr:hypothetical protein [Planctomycetota bacterium]